MSLIGGLHGYVHSRRVRVLRESLSDLLPAGAGVLDVGCGDGLLASLIMAQRPDVRVRGIDVLIRGETRIPVSGFDGRRIPFPDKSFDVVMFVDVLHHAEDAMVLLRESTRVARRSIVIKDHLLQGVLGGTTLRLMDRVGNARHGVALPYNYWSPRQWTDAFTSLNLRVEVWRTDLRLYAGLANLVFGRSLHFVARLEPGHVEPGRLPGGSDPTPS